MDHKLTYPSISGYDSRIHFALSRWGFWESGFSGHSGTRRRSVVGPLSVALNAEGIVVTLRLSVRPVATVVNAVSGDVPWFMLPTSVSCSLLHTTLLPAPVFVTKIISEMRIETSIKHSKTAIATNERELISKTLFESNAFLQDK